MSGRDVTKAELAAICGVSLPTIGAWVRKGCPFVSKGNKSKAWTFNTAAVLEWREEQIVQQTLGDTKSLDIDEARRRKVAAEAAMMELDLAKRRGEMIEIDEVAQVVGDDYANVRAKLLSMPTKLSPQLMGVSDTLEVEGLIRRQVEEALEELTADEVYGGPETGSGEAETGKPKAAA